MITYNQDGLAQSIIELCYKQFLGSERAGRHDAIVNAISNLLRSQGYWIYNEYPMKFNSLYVRKGKVIATSGLLDIFAYDNQNHIAIEYDSGATIKYKSIAKLLQCKADLCMGIFQGGGVYNHSKSVGKLNHVLSSVSQRNVNEIWLIDINGKVAEKIKI